MEDKRGLLMKYFVLSPHSKSNSHARASRAAMLAYASEIEPNDALLASELREWVEVSDD